MSDNTSELAKTAPEQLTFSYWIQSDGRIYEPLPKSRFANDLPPVQLNVTCDVTYIRLDLFEVLRAQLSTAEAQRDQARNAVAQMFTAIDLEGEAGIEAVHKIARAEIESWSGVTS